MQFILVEHKRFIAQNHIASKLQTANNVSIEKITTQTQIIQNLKRCKSKSIESIILSSYNVSKAAKVPDISNQK